MRIAVKQPTGCRRAGTGLLLLAAVLGGCQSSGGDRKNAAADLRASEPVEHPMLAGIPLPRGYTTVPERTLAFENDQFRKARYEFNGGASRNALLAFFLDQMPTAGFRAIERREEDGVYELRFASDREVSTVRIGKRGLGQTYFVIDVGPRATAPRGVGTADRR